MGSPIRNAGADALRGRQLQPDGPHGTVQERRPGPQGNPHDAAVTGGHRAVHQHDTSGKPLLSYAQLCSYSRVNLRKWFIYS
jgi:hypothetical protein